MVKCVNHAGLRAISVPTSVALNYKKAILRVNRVGDREQAHYTNSTISAIDTDSLKSLKMDRFLTQLSPRPALLAHYSHHACPTSWGQQRGGPRNSLWWGSIWAFLSRPQVTTSSLCDLGCRRWSCFAATSLVAVALSWRMNGK